MAWNNQPYLSPIPTGLFGQVGEVLGQIGQQAQSWIPLIVQMMQAKERGARESLQTILNLPGLSDDERQKAVAGYMAETNRLPAWMHLNWPQQSVPGPVITPGQPAQPAVPGVAPQPQDINTPEGGLTPPTGGHPEKPAVPEVRGPATTRYYVPPRNVMDSPISALEPKLQASVRQAVNALNPDLWPIIQGMPLGQAIQQFPMLGMALQYGGFGQPSEPAPTTGAGTPGPQSMVPGGPAGRAPGQTGPQASAAAPAMPPMFVRPGMPWGTAFPQLAQMAAQSTDRNIQQQLLALAQQPIPISFFTPQGFNYQSAQAFLDNTLRTNNLIAPSQYEKARLADIVEQRVRSYVKDQIAMARTVAVGPNGQQRAHDILQKLKDTIGGMQDDPRYQGIDFESILSGIPTSDVLARPSAMAQEETAAVELVKQKAKELGSLNAALAWVRQHDPVAYQLYEKSTRIPGVNVTVTGPGSDQTVVPGLSSVRGNPVRTYKDKQGHEHFEEEVTAGHWTPVGPDAIVGRPIDNRVAIQKLNEDIEGVWSQLRGSGIPKPVTDAIQRIVHGKDLPGDLKLVNDAAVDPASLNLPNAAAPAALLQRLLKLEGQKRQLMAQNPNVAPTPPGASKPTPQTPKPGAGKQISMADLRRKAAQEKKPIAQLIQEAKDQGYSIIP